MFQKLKSILSFASVLLLGLFLWERKSKEDTEAKLEVSKLDEKNASDKEDIKNTDKLIAEENAKIDQAQKDLKDENSKTLSPEQEVEFWNNRKSDF